MTVRGKVKVEIGSNAPETQRDEIRERAGQHPGGPTAAEIVASVLEELADQWVSVLYRDKVRSLRTRSYSLKAPRRANNVEVMRTLLGWELKVGKRRLLCPDFATARYLSFFAMLGVDEVAVPYDITQIARLADLLQSSWMQLTASADLATRGMTEEMRDKVRRLLAAREREAIDSIGAGPRVPQFNQQTRQRRRS